MYQSPSWEANGFSASQEIPRTLRNQKVHYRIHNTSSLVPVLGQKNAVHNHPSYLSKFFNSSIKFLYQIFRKSFFPPQHNVTST